MSTDAEREIASLLGRLTSLDKSLRGILVWRDPVTGQFKTERVSDAPKYSPLRHILYAVESHRKKDPWESEARWLGYPIPAAKSSSTSPEFLALSLAADAFESSFSEELQTALGSDEGDLSDDELSAATQALKDYYSEALGSPRGYLSLLRTRLSGAS